MKNELLELVAAKILTFRGKETTKEATYSRIWEVASLEKLIAVFGSTKEATLAEQIVKSNSIVSLAELIANDELLAIKQSQE